MSVTFEKNRAHLAGSVEVEAAEGLLEWLQAHPRGRVDLGRCGHLHAAVVQVLMAVPGRVAAWPQDPDLERWLRGALEGGRA